MPETDTASGPYAAAAALYWDNGWQGVLPLPSNQKKHPPTGYTGNQGTWPSRADVQAWIDGRDGAGNIGLRLPPDVIGIDVDNYSGKQGAATLARLEQQYGPLPPTWLSTSRDDGVSGIRLYKVPPGLDWPGEFGPGIETIRHGHRYVVAWPSVHPEGRVYRWYNPDRVVAINTVPLRDRIPDLTGQWIAGVTGGRLAVDIPKANLGDLEVNAWLTRHGGGQPCQAVQDTVDRYIHERFTDGSSRHDAAKDATARLFRMAAEGHPGVIQAVNDIGVAFRGAIATDPGRSKDQGEWSRLYLGAIRIAAVDTPDIPPADPCILPDVTVIDVSTLTVEDAANAAAERAAEAAQRALETEIRQQRVRRQARQALDQEEAAATFRVPPSRFTLLEELEIPDQPVSYVIDQLMPAGANVLLTAQYKTGKTTLINHLARCLADEEKFLGRYQVNPPDGRTALFNYEVDENQYRRWLRQADITGTPLISPLNLRGYRLPLLVPHVEDWIVRWLQERDIKVWVVDPFARAFVGSGVSENDNTEVGRFLDALDVIKTRAGVTELVLPTHTGRAEMDEGQERARGATRLDDWADVRWIYTKDESETRYFHATGRDVEVEEMALQFNEATRQLHVAGGTRANTRNQRMRDAVISVVQNNPGIGSNKLLVAVRQTVGRGRTETIRDAVVLAEVNGLIRVEPGPRGGKLHFPVGPSVVLEEDE